MLENKKIGFAFTGSFCTFSTVISQLEEIKKHGCDILPIMSPNAYSTDTRFGTAKDFIEKIRNICQNDIIHTIDKAEPIGPKKLLDLLIIAPCTGNTLAKLAYGITDTSVTLAAKAHLRNDRPILIAISTNDGLSNAAKNIGDIKKYLTVSDDIDSKFLTFSYELSAISGDLKNMLDNSDFSEAELDNINDRISFIDDICRKYGGNEEAVIEYFNKISNELEQFSVSETLVKSLQEKVDVLENDVIENADKITKSRKKAANEFCERLCNTLQFLQMPNVAFDVNFQQGKYKANGCDEVEFLISANPGQPLKPMSKIASGGELSRIMLAIKSVFSDIDDIGTVIFDEIDTGISGTAADKVGTKLAQISSNRQIICVTHLAQIAAKANTHFLIEKNIDFNSTETTIKSISGEDRVKEIARIISGGELTDSLKVTARELLGM